MKYTDGQEIKIGDKLTLWDDYIGIVVADIDAVEYSSLYPKEDWEYLNTGVLIVSEHAGLIHYSEPEISFKLLERSQHNRDQQKEGGL